MTQYRLRAVLVRPAQEYLAGYIAALQRGWSPDNWRPEAADEELQAIKEDSSKFLATLVDKEGLGPPIKLPDGSLVPRNERITPVLPRSHWIFHSALEAATGLRDGGPSPVASGSQVVGIGSRGNHHGSEE